MPVIRVNCASCGDSLTAHSTTFWNEPHDGYVCLECRNLMMLYPPSSKTVASIKTQVAETRVVKEDTDAK